MRARAYDVAVRRGSDPLRNDTERYRSGRNGGASKASCRVTGTWVRIPPSPPAFAKPLASLAGYGWLASEWRERSCEGCPPEPRAKRALGEGGQLRDRISSLPPISNCVPHKTRFVFPPISTQFPLAPPLLLIQRGLSGKAIRLHHPKLEQSAEALRRCDVGRRGAGAWTQCRAKPVDGSVETVGHRRVHRVPKRADGRALRAVLEVRGGSLVREQSLYRMSVTLTRTLLVA